MFACFCGNGWARRRAITCRWRIFFGRIRQHDEVRPPQSDHSRNHPYSTSADVYVDDGLLDRPVWQAQRRERRMKPNRPIEIILRRGLLASVGVLSLLLTRQAGPSAAPPPLPRVVSTVAALQTALADAAVGLVVDIRITSGTYDIHTPLALDAPAGTTLTVENDSGGRVTLHSFLGDE